MIEITIPRLGWSMEEGKFTGWLTSPGEFVNKGDFVFELEAEKATQEIESFDSGVLCVPADAPKPGDTVQVGQVIGLLLAEGEEPPSSLADVLGNGNFRPEITGSQSPSTAFETGSRVERDIECVESSESTTSASPFVSRSPSESLACATEPTAGQRSAGPAARRLARQLNIDLNKVSTPDPTGRIITDDVKQAHLLRQGGWSEKHDSRHGSATSSPRARRRAEQLGIQWQQVVGTGRNGRVRERDIIAFATAARNVGTSMVPDRSREIPAAPMVPGDHNPASRIRQTIAKRMLDGIHQAAPVTLTTKVNASKLVVLRDRYKAASCETKPSYNDILIKLTSIALKEQPQLNACWHNGGVWNYHQINIAMAVETDAGLIAPVIHNADELTMTAIAERAKMLRSQAVSGELSTSQLQGGTFTVTNLGKFGVDAFTPILNLPQAAILGVGRIVREPVVRDDQIVPGETLTLSLTFDHRVTDGAPAARWLERLTELIEAATEVVAIQ